MATSSIADQNVSADVNGSTNMATQPPPNVNPHFLLETELSRNIRYVLLAIIFVFTVVGNVTVCVIPYKHRRMRTFTYFLITNLAVSDVGGILYLPFIMYQVETESWPFGPIMCKIVNPSITLFGIVTTNTLVAIALDRFVALVFPFKSRPTHKETVLILALTWLTALICVLPAFGIRVIRNNYCIEVFPGQTEEEQNQYRRAYGVFLYLVNNCVPVAVIVLLYVKIVVQLKRNSVALPSQKSHPPNDQQHPLQNESQLSSSPHGGRCSLSLSTDIEWLRKRNKMEKEFTNMLVVVVLIFVFCYVPYQTFFFIAEFRPTVYGWKYLYVVYPYLYVLIWLPNALNPICYGSMNEQYAKAFKSLLRCTSQSQIYIRGRLNSLSHMPNTGMLGTRSTNTVSKERNRQSGGFDSTIPSNQ